jgi:hypothetical protein
VRNLRFFAVAVMLFSLIPPAQAASKPSGACKVKNQTQIFQGKKYTCIQSGKKLVWDAGRKYQPTTQTTTPAPTPTQAPAPASTPTPTPTPTQPVGQVPTPIAPIPTPPQITWSNLDPVWTSKVAYQKVNEYIQSQPTPTLTYKTLLSPTVSNRPYDLYIYGIESVARLWEPIFKDPNFNIALFTELDGEWIDLKQRELMGQYLINPIEQLQSNRLKGAGCNIGGFYLPNLIVFCVKDDAALSREPNAKYSASHAFAHEYTHFMGMTSSIVSNKGIASSGRLGACWFWEGSATFYGNAIGGTSLKDFENRRLSSLNETLLGADLSQNRVPGTTRELLREGNPDKIKQLYLEVGKNFQSCTEIQMSYALGQLATEVLVAIYGQPSIEKLILEFARIDNWDEAFNKTYGITVTEFYERITPYVISQAKRFITS